MKVVDDEIISKLYLEAKKSERKRSHYLLHKSHNDKVQRLLIAMVKGSFVEAHYHYLPHQWEMFQIIEGEIILTFYFKNGEIKEKYILNKSSSIKLIEIHPTEIHSVECVSDKALLLEVKEGPFKECSSKLFLSNYMVMD